MKSSLCIMLCFDVVAASIWSDVTDEFVADCLALPDALVAAGQMACYFTASGGQSSNAGR